MLRTRSVLLFPNFVYRQLFSKDGAPRGYPWRSSGRYCFVGRLACKMAAVIAAATAGRRCNLPLAFWTGLLASLLSMCVGIAVSNPHAVLFLN
jgi:hypothetical protein